MYNKVHFYTNFFTWRVFFTLQNILNAVLEGNFSMDLHELPSPQPKVGVFVSSTFTDTKAERNILMRGKLPSPSLLASIWACAWQKALCGQRILRSDWTSVHFDQSIRCLYEDTLNPC